MKKGRHRRFEEARALKRSTDFDPDRLYESLKGDPSTNHDDDEDDDVMEYDDALDDDD